MSGSQEIYFPDDLWIQILSFLPVKTLVRFRAVSKSLMAIIDDPDFASFHLRSFPANRHETQLYLLTLPNVESTQQVCSSNDDMIWMVWGSIDGLLLLSMTCYKQKRLELMLWNPSTRKERWLPSRFRPTGIEAIALGYDQLRRDYKVLLLRNSYPDEPHLDHALYSVNKGSWKMLDSNACGFGTSLFCSVPFSGGVVWIEKSPCGRRQHVAMFDFAAETLRYAVLPYALFFIYNVFRVDDGGRSLGVLAADERVWVLDTGTMQWTSRYKIAASMTMRSLDCLWTLVRSEENGELVLLERFKGQRIKLVFESYDDVIVPTHVFIPRNASATVVGIYVESLVKL